MNAPKAPISTAKKPVRYMDFVGRKPRSSSDPLASRPVMRVAPKTHAPVVKRVASVADQIPAKRASVSYPTVKRVEEKPLISRQPATSRDLYPDPKPTARKSDNLALKASAALSGSAKPAINSSEKKSPFLENYTIDKRPLSSSVKKKQEDNFEKLSFLGVSETESPRKNVYDKKPAKKPKKDKKAKSGKPDSSEKVVKIIDDTGEKRGVPVWAIILITILLGAAVGAGIYFLLPK
ncbi:hypothetical protein IKE71_03610 [Candidatus Saccharibacteria bacterium]|nr:hypothetical protein [Candidatus Saccharibacteria bacterium]